MNDRFPTKDPDEVLVLSVDMVDLVGAETILSAEWYIAREDNLTENTDAMLVGQASVSGNIVSQKVQGGVSGGSYIHRVKIDLDPSGRSLIYGVRQKVVLGG